jgi:hypothetical protein
MPERGMVKKALKMLKKGDYENRREGDKKKCPLHYTEMNTFPEKCIVLDIYKFVIKIEL